jgi:hypothetical protein
MRVIPLTLVSTPELGAKVPFTNETDIVSQMEKIPRDLAKNRDPLDRLRQQPMSSVRERLSSNAKAESVTRVLNWAVQRGAKPDLPQPKMLHTGACRADLEEGSPAIRCGDSSVHGRGLPL